jgi:hypothetical protein
MILYERSKYLDLLFSYYLISFNKKLRFSNLVNSKTNTQLYISIKFFYTIHTL